MTLWASEVHPNVSRLRIHSNSHNTVTVVDHDYGKSTRIEVVIEEDLAQMKSLWSSLGKLIEQKEQQEKEATNESS